MRYALNISKRFFAMLKNKVNIIKRLYQQEKQLKEQAEQLNEALSIQRMLTDNLIQTATELKESKNCLEISNEQLKISYAELERTNNIFQAFVPKQFINRIVFDQGLHPGYANYENLSILFADIRNYTKLSEKMNLEENFEFLNQFFDAMNSPINQNQGFIDKFIGDAVMALFAEEPSEEIASADNAVNAAIAMQNALSLLNEKRQKQNLSEFQIGIGINTGKVAVGVLGSAHRLNSTVIGDHVNIGARLEEMTKEYNAKILISEHTYTSLENQHYSIRQVDTVKLRGQSQSTVLYEVFDSDCPSIRKKKQQTLKFFDQGVQYYQEGKFIEAQWCFRECLEKIPEDVVALKYLKRCHYLQKHPPQSDQWDGVISDSDVLIEHKIRRRSERYNINIPLQIYSYNHQETYDGILVDYSKGGAQIWLDSDLKKGELLTFNYDEPFHSMIIQEESLNHSLFQVAWEDVKNDDSSGHAPALTDNSELPSSHSYVVGLELLASQPCEVFSRKQYENLKLKNSAD